MLVRCADYTCIKKEIREMSKSVERSEVVEFIRHLMRATQAAAIEWIGDGDVFRTNILRNSHDASRASGIQVTRRINVDPEVGKPGHVGSIVRSDTYSIQTYISDVHFGQSIVSSFDIPGPCDESMGEDVGLRLWELMEVVQERGGAATVDAMVGVIVERLSQPAAKVVKPRGLDPGVRRLAVATSGG
jgi:hypothetical protein